jgi:hypothetical protein
MYRFALRMLLVPAFVCAVVPAAAWGDIYMWTDDRGNTVISDKAPAASGAVGNFETVVKEPERRTRKPAAAPSRTEELLLDKIENLERQLSALSAQRYTTAPPPAPAYSASYYTPPPPQPAYDPYYSSGFFSPYGPVVVSSPLIIRRGFGFGQRFGTHGSFRHRGRR